MEAIRTAPGVFTLRRLRASILPDGQPTPMIYERHLLAARCLARAARLVDWARFGEGRLVRLVEELASKYREASDALPALEVELIRVRTTAGLPPTVRVGDRTLTAAHLACLAVADVVLREVNVALQAGAPICFCDPDTGDPVELPPEDIRSGDPSDVDLCPIRVQHAREEIRAALLPLQALADPGTLLAELRVEAVFFGERTGQEVDAEVGPAKLTPPLTSTGLPWREEDLGDLQKLPRLLIRYMSMRDKAMVRAVCREVWEEEFPDVSEDALKSCIRKANVFLRENASPWVICRDGDTIKRM